MLLALQTNNEEIFGLLSSVFMKLFREPHLKCQFTNPYFYF